MPFYCKALVFSCLLAIFIKAPGVYARENIHIVGSSTVYPFATVVAERIGRLKKYKTPTVESTGSGGGFKLFCAGVGESTPDITNASRAIKRSERDRCLRNGVKGTIEVKFGYDGIVLANSKVSPKFKLTLREIYLALAKQVPDPKKAGVLILNPYKTWKEINPSLPNKKIRVLGPPPTSGTRDAFVELALEGGCKTFDFIAALKKTKKFEYKKVCHTVREDGAWVEAGENDNLIIQKLIADENAMGVFGFSFLQENSGKIQGAEVNGKQPTFENISSGIYPVSRSLYFYVKKGHVGKIKGLEQYVKHFVSKRAIGKRGYLVDRGLIPLNSLEFRKYRARVLKELRN